MTDDRRRPLLRPVRLRHRHRPVPDLEAAPRRAAALLQREVRLLRAEPLRRRRAGPRRLAAPTSRPRARCSSSSRATSRCPPGIDHLRGPARRTTSTAACCRGCSRPKKMARHRAQGARVLRPQPRPARRLGRLRLHRATSAPRCRCARSACSSASPRRTRRRSATGSTTGLRLDRGRDARRSSAAVRDDGAGSELRGVHRLARRSTRPTT